MIDHKSKKGWVKQQSLTKEAISLATQGRWQDAADLNQRILRLSPDDGNALNRLGKALMELGRYAEARDAFRHSLEIVPSNTIAKKNLQRLEMIAEDIEVRHAGPMRPAPHHFIEETGKAGVTTLVSPGPPETLLRLAAGDPVVLRVDGSKLMVDSTEGKYLGYVEQRLAARLLYLMAGGNRYDGSITSASQSGISVILREVYQHPSQADKVSFPSKRPDDFRPYVKPSIKRYESELYGDWEDDEEVERLPKGMGLVDSERDGISISDEDREDS